MKDLNDCGLNEFIIEDASCGTSISVITDMDTHISNKEGTKVEEDQEYPILPLRGSTFFPGILQPITIGRKSSMRLMQDAGKTKKMIGVFSQKDSNIEEPNSSDLYPYGILARLIKMIELPDGNKTALIQGFCRVKLIEAHDGADYMMGHIQQAEEIIPAEDDKEFAAIMEAMHDVVEKFASMGELKNFDTSFSFKGMQNQLFVVNYLCPILAIPNSEKFQLLQEDNISKRALHLLGILNRECQFASLKAKIHMRTQEDINKQQREYFLQQQLKNIQAELGDSIPSSIAKFAERGTKKKWNEATYEVFCRELDKLKKMNQQSPEYQIQTEYIETLLSLPWNEETKDKLNLNSAEKTLDRDHYGMTQVKERIMEYLAVLQRRGDLKSPILCLYGPPGVGKTSLGKSIAKAMKRKYVRVSLGGVHDEAEIRGHRRTYIGAMPGRIIKSIQEAGSCNPVFVLDEIDKVGQDGVHGDPASALLEVLDPEQNKTFHDNYLDCDFDLSKVMFIATANNIGTIPTPLLDRMELIEVSGYLTEEKIEIARRHLIPREIKNVGMEGYGIKFTKAAIEKVIENYTRESGVRELDKQIGHVLRKLTLKYAKDSILPPSSMKPEDIVGLLGPEKYTRDRYQGNNYAGVVIGLAWTSVGGEILFIETSLSRGKNQKLTLTGNLGDVMKESAVLALEYLKAHNDMLGIDPRVFENWNIHIHVPEGAVPKDGPSAGITICTSLASALTQRKVRKNIAMTGEITLRGKVLPVGGIKEKILAAKRAGITDIMMCKDNEKDIKQIPEIYLKGLTFHYVENMKDVLDFALLDEKVDNPIDFTVKDDDKDADI